MLQQHHQQQVQAEQVKEGQLYLKLNISKINSTLDAQDPLDQAKDAGFDFLQNQSSHPNGVKVRANLDPKKIFLTRDKFLPNVY